MLKSTVSLTPASPDNPMHIPATSFSDPAEHFNLLLCFGLGFFFPQDYLSVRLACRKKS